MFGTKTSIMMEGIVKFTNNTMFWDCNVNIVIVFTINLMT